jgi:hypothetical protein
MGAMRALAHRDRQPHCSTGCSTAASREETWRGGKAPTFVGGARRGQADATATHCVSHTGNVAQQPATHQATGVPGPRTRCRSPRCRPSVPSVHSSVEPIATARFKRRRISSGCSREPASTDSALALGKSSPIGRELASRSPWWNSREAARGDLRPLARRGRRTRCGDIVQEAQRSQRPQTPAPQAVGAAWGRLRCSARSAMDPASPPLARLASGPTALPTQPTGVSPRAPRAAPLATTAPIDYCATPLCAVNTPEVSS